MKVAKGRVAYEPNSLDSGGPRECPVHGFASFPEAQAGEKQRLRPESFADHYTQARLFWNSMTEPEKRHIASAFGFELGKVETPAIRKRMLGHLANIDGDLQARVEAALGMEGEADTIKPAVAPKTMKPSPALSLIAKAPATIKGRTLGILITDGADAKLLAALRKAVKAEGAAMQIVAPMIGGATLSDGKRVAADHALAGGPSVLFDAVALLPSDDGAEKLASEATAIDWLRDAFGHLKAIGHVPAADVLFDRAGIGTDADEGTVSLAESGGIKAFIAAAKKHRIWEREPALRAAGTPPGGKAKKRT